MRILINIILGLIIAFMSVLSFSCESQEPISLPEADRSPPTALIIYPPESATVSGIVTIQVHATDNDKVDSVMFLVNQDTIGTDSKGENDIFEKKWTTSDFREDVFHSLSFIAYDRKGNSFRPYPILVKVDNNDDIMPEAQIISPFSGAIVSGIVPIIINATDNDGVEFVRIFINSMLQGYVTEPPYTFSWNSNLIQDGNYSIYAVATDLTGNETTVTPIIVTTNNGNINDITPPTGAIIYPASGITISGEVTISVTASDNSGRMGQVIFSINGSDLFTDTIEPYEYSWNTIDETEDEYHVITIILEDPSENQAVLNPITVFINNEPDIDVTPPSVNIISPTGGQELNGTVTINVFAEDNHSVEYVEFFINGETAFVDIVSPYSYNWNTEMEDDDQYHMIGAATEDSTGNFSAATPIMVYVNNADNEPPIGQILYPYPGQIVSDSVAIQISATDNEGIQSVEISINGDLVITDTEFPYQYDWDTGTATEDQHHVISASITDISNNTAYLDPISVLVNNQNPEDTTPPIAVISNPSSGQTVGGTVNFRVDANDDIGISSVEFFIDGSSVSVDNDADYSYNWDTSSLVNGTQYTLGAQVTDTSNNITTAQPVLVTVSN